MSIRRASLPFLLVFGCLTALPTMAVAQSSIVGVVKDNTGAVLPGVSIEATSPALIEQIRSVTSDGQGRYAIVDLRPGIYTVTFSLTGFSPVKFERLELPAAFTATVDAEMRVGSLQETVTVSGASPVVDVQSAQRTQILTRDVVDNLPTSRGVTSIATLIPGVRMSNPDVGGSQAMEQTYGTANGASQSYNTYEVDGMKLNSLSGDGQRTSYFNNALFSEVTYEISGHSAESTSGGVRLNMIPREGGNMFAGQLYAGGTDGPWQWTNVTPELRARGLTSGDAVRHTYDINIAQGGPIIRNRLWFFGGGAFQSTEELVANTVMDDGRQGSEDQYVNNATLRLTWQVNPANKVNAYVDRIWKFKGHEMGAFTDPETAAGRRDPLLYLLGQVKWVSTIKNRLMLDFGYATNILRYTVYYQPGIQKERGTPEWYAGARKVDRATNYAWGAATPYVLRIPDRHMVSAAATYVTGSHTFKVGVQESVGFYREYYDSNADLTQEYRNGAPESVLVYNTPADSKTAMNMDLGVFVQDSWKFNRLSLNPGVRFEWFHGSVEETTQNAGRFAPVRHFEGATGLPNWFNISPRFGTTYDLTGDAKTALKFSASKYTIGEATQYPKNFDPVYLASERRTWQDLNGDDIAQENEIGQSQDARFGIRSVATPDPNHEREYSWEYSVAVQREVRTGMSVTAGWTRRNYYNLSQTTNLLRSFADWSPVTVVNPLNGELITAYNLNRAKLGVVDNYFTNSTDSDVRRRDFDGLEFSSVARLRNGSNISGGWTFGRTVNVNCDSTDNPNTLRFCDQRELDTPFRHDFKVAGNVPLPLQISVSAVMLSYSGNPLNVNWQISPTTRVNGALVIPNMTESSLTIALIPPNSKFLDRWNQLDLAVKRSFKFGRREVMADVNLFNALNSGVVLGENQTFGTALGTPSSILKNRMLRLAVQAKF